MADTGSFDDIEIRRPALAASFLGLLRGQPGRPLALFAPRRVGQTYFLDQDLTPAARVGGLLPVYAAAGPGHVGQPGQCRGRAGDDCQGARRA